MRWSPAAVILLLAVPALARGDRYVGPVDEILPHLREGSDWPPPDMSGGPVPPPDGPTGTPAVPGGGEASDRSRGLTYESWRFVWHLRENGIVEARARERRGMPALSGEGISAGTIEKRILPALRAAAGDGRLGVDINSEAVLGLVRAGDDASIGFLRDAARNASEDPHYHAVVEAYSVLALGWIDGVPPGNAAVLRAIIQDPETKGRSRCFACFALARMERRKPSLDTLRLLESALFNEGDGRPYYFRDAVAAAYALGRLEAPEASAILRRFLDAPLPKAPERKWHASLGEWNGDLLACHAAASLGRAAGASGDGGECEDGLRTLENAVKKGDPLTVQGAVLGLGFLGAVAAPEVATKCVRRLETTLDAEGTEGQARRFALIALARIASKGPAGTRDIAMEILVRSLKASRPTPSWAALAAGLAGEGRTAPERAECARLVRKAWLTASPPGARIVEDRGGCLVAMGLLRDLSARPLLEAILGDEGEDRDLRGYAAAALGLLGDGAAIQALRTVVKNTGARRWKRPAVVALGLLGDFESVDAILTVMQDPKSSGHLLGGGAQALGFLRDGGAVDPLLEIAGDEKYPDLTRGMAWQALARMASWNRPDPFADLAEDVPYRAWTWEVGEIWSIL